MNTITKILLSLFVLIITAIVSFYVFIHITFSGLFTGPFYEKQDLIDNYEKKTIEISEASRYFKSILPEKSYVKIEFENSKLRIFHVKTDAEFDSNWDLKINSHKADSLFSVLGWENDEALILKSKLKAANSISIESGEPVTIGWQRSGMGMFFYNIFEESLNDSLISEFNDGCTYLFYKDNVSLEYGGGAIGPQCFPSYYQENKAQ